MEAMNCNINLQTSLFQLLSNILTSGHKILGNHQAVTPSFPYLLNNVNLLQLLLPYVSLLFLLNISSSVPAKLL